MKKIYILIIAVLLGGIAKGQWQNQPTKPNAKDIINKTISEKIPQSHFHEQLKKPIASKSVSWNYDTIVAFDWLNNLKQRITQTFDGNGNVLTNITQNWDYNTWENITRYTYTYDTYANKLTDLYEKWQNNAWVNYSKHTFTFNANGKKLTYLYEKWQNNAWVNYSRYTYTYDASGNMLTVFRENWEFIQNGSGSYYAWVNQEKHTYTYNTNGNMLTDLYEQWQNNAWVNYSKYTYTYDTNGNMLTELKEQWQNNAWVNDDKHTYTYNANGNMLTDLYEYWQNNIWVNDNRRTYTYDANGNMLTELLEKWQNNAWLNYSRITYTFNTNGNMLTDLYEQWQNNAWVNYSKYTYTYDTNGNMLTYLSEKRQNNAWLNYFKDTYTYDSFGNSITGKYESWYNNNWDLANGSLDVLSSQQKLISVSSSAHRYQAHFISTNNPMPLAADTITGSSSVCQGQTSVNYSVPTIANSTSYIWTLPSGASGTSSANTITVNYSTSAVSGYITVKGSNSFGTGDSSSLAITVNPLPVLAGNISGLATVYQGQASVNYSVPTITNATSYIWTLPTAATGTSTTNTITVNYSSSAFSGNITVKGINSCGIGDTSSLYITVNPFIPNCSAQFDLVADTAVLHHYFAVNNASGVPPLQYNWSWGDGTFSTTAYPTHTYSAAGYYNICLTIIDSVGCTTTYCDSSYLQKDPNAIISVQVIPQGTLGISNLISDKIKIYPNPAKENLIIELMESKISQRTTISIYNIQGQLCRQIISNQSKTEVDIKDLSAGIYIIKVNNDKETLQGKFVKK